MREWQSAVSVVRILGVLPDSDPEHIRLLLYKGDPVVGALPQGHAPTEKEPVEELRHQKIVARAPLRPVTMMVGPQHV